MLSYTTIYYQILSMFISLIISRLYHHILYYTISLYLGYWLIGTSGTALSKAEWPQKSHAIRNQSWRVANWERLCWGIYENIYHHLPFYHGNPWETRLWMVMIQVMVVFCFPNMVYHLCKKYVQLPSTFHIFSMIWSFQESLNPFLIPTACPATGKTHHN